MPPRKRTPAPRKRRRDPADDVPFDPALATAPPGGSGVRLCHACHAYRGTDLVPLNAGGVPVCQPCRDCLNPTDQETPPP